MLGGGDENPQDRHCIESLTVVSENEHEIFLLHSDAVIRWKIFLRLHLGGPSSELLGLPLLSSLGPRLHLGGPSSELFGLPLLSSQGPAYKASTPFGEGSPGASNFYVSASKVYKHPLRSTIGRRGRHDHSINKRCIS